jgi:hypothetical protein
LAATHIYGFDAAAHDHCLVPGEETLTDSLMLGLMRRRFPYVHFRGRLPRRSHLRVHQFRNTVEARIGADWNLLFLLPTGRVSFRVQAKRLYASGSYSKKDPQQLQRLLQVSARQGAIPIYGFYNGPSSGASIRSTCRVAGDERRGCTVVDARLGLRSGLAWSRNGIGSAAIPLECLASCACFGPGGSGGRGQTKPDGGPVQPIRQSSAIRKIDAAALSIEHTSRVATAASVDFDPDLAPLLDAAVTTSWPDEVEVAVLEWMAGDTAALDALGVDGYFNETSHVMLVTAEID